MTKEQVLWKMISELLVDYYLPANISFGFKNGVVPPELNDYIIIRKLNQKQNYLPQRDYNILLQQKELTAFGDWEYQVDLYGNNADDSSDYLYTYLASPDASNYLLPYEQGIGMITQPVNLTNPNDRDNYMKRYMLKFTALNKTKRVFPLAGISLKDVQLTSREIT